MSIHRSVTTLELPEQRTPCAMRPHMKLAQYSHQCGPRNVCTWGHSRHAHTHTQ